MNFKYKYSLLLFAFFCANVAYGQETKFLTLKDAVSLGLANSKNLQLSQLKIEEAISVYNQAVDLALPTANTSAIYNHAEIPSHTLQLGSGSPIKLPKSADAFIGTLGVQELIFAGNKLKYAKESTSILKNLATLGLDSAKEDVIVSIVSTYLNLYKIAASKEIINQNLLALDQQYKQTKRFFEQGLVTKNDVLKVQLQKSNVELISLDLDKNQNIVNYNLNVMLGLPENTILKTAALINIRNENPNFNNFLDSAMLRRFEIKKIDYRVALTDKNILSTKANTLPTFGVGLNAYYVNPSGSFIPPVNQFITPITLGATLSWNISSLWNNKNKLAEKVFIKQEAVLYKSIFIDQLKKDVNVKYQNYLQSLNNIKLLTITIQQASENAQIVQSKYSNNIASITEKLDADTQLFQSKINLEISKADAELAYYNLLKSTGQILSNYSLLNQ